MGEAGAGPAHAWIPDRPLADADMLHDACVVIIDDVPANVMLLKRLIRSVGVERVHGVTDPRDAVQRCLEVSADLVLLDLQMPYLDGLAVMSSLRAALPGDEFVPVLVLTADTASETRDRALRAGANDFLTKPFDRSEVVLRVGNLLQTRSLYATVQRHNAALRAELERRVDEERRIAAARQEQADRIDAVLSGGLLRMVFQPIVDLVSGAVVGVEALARFATEPSRPPNEWFDDATRVNRGVELELAAIAAALEEISDVPRDGFMSVNVSPATVMTPALGRLLDEIPADRVMLELTEHTRVQDYEALVTELGRLRRRGVRIAVDDTGSGYAGLRHLLRVRPDIIKLDIALTCGVDADPARRALAVGLTRFAREIDAVVIAEGIENEHELETLKTLEVDWGQGYHLARPGALPAVLEVNAPPRRDAGA
jgi:EAL domain-containing protein (putative c-di-GMP-specific phosphodiesterase class I)